MTVTSLRWGHVAHVALLVLRSLATLRVTVNAFESVANFKLCYGLYRPRNPWHARWLATCDCRADPRRPRNRVCAPAARTVYSHVNRAYRKKHANIHIVDNVLSPREMLQDKVDGMTDIQAKQWTPLALSFLGDCVWEVSESSRQRREKSNYKAMLIVCLRDPNQSRRGKWERPQRVVNYRTFRTT
eukprot:1195126-Prorocentrum_minimum.AAC.4